MYIQTQDIVLAAYLKSVGANLIKIEVTGSKGIFHFDNAVQQVVQDYQLGKGLVEPIQFHNAIKQLVTATRNPPSKIK